VPEKKAAKKPATPSRPQTAKKAAKGKAVVEAEPEASVEAPSSTTDELDQALEASKDADWKVVAPRSRKNKTVA
jgi:hypothetical protein